jgi:hypothetical protein
MTDLDKRTLLVFAGFTCLSPCFIASFETA